jgi:hypothetical protein
LGIAPSSSTAVAYVATHNDSDHTAAAPDLLEHYPSRSTLNRVFLVVDRPARSEGDTAEDAMPLLAYARRRERSQTIERLHILQVADENNEPRTLFRDDAAGLALQLLYPKPAATIDAVVRGRPSPVATNQACAILRLVVGNPPVHPAVLITGDANCMSFGVARSYGFDLGASALSVPHHGGAVPQPSGAPDWSTVVGWVRPKVAVASAGHGTVPGPTTTRRHTFDPLRGCHAQIACTQLTKHCHADFLAFHPSVCKITSPMPQMSGHHAFPNAVGCMGTIAVRIAADGAVSVHAGEAHQQDVDSRVTPPPGCPHCKGTSPGQQAVGA